MIILHFTWFIFCFSIFADMLCNERPHYIIHTTKTLNSLSSSNIITGGWNTSVFHPSSFYMELTSKQLRMLPNDILPNKKKQFWRMVINQIMSHKHLTYSDTAEHISSFSEKKKNTFFFFLPGWSKNTHACSSLLKVSSQQVVDSLDNKAVMASMHCRASGGWVALDKGCLSKHSKVH